MVSVISKNSQFPSSVCELHASLDGRYGWFLCTSHEEQNHALEEIQTQIKLEILNSGVLEVSKMEIESWLKAFFADFHWKLHASLRKTDLQEKGISLMFGVIYDAEIYFVQFGRIFCAVSKGRKLQQLGRDWKNFHVQSLDEMALLGQSEGDIKTKPQRLRLDENESLFVLPGSIARQVFDSGNDAGSLLPLIESYSGADKALWLVLKNTPQLQRTKKRGLTKLEITSLLLLLATFLAIAYMAFGNRIFDVALHRVKKEVATGSMRAMTTEVIANLGKVANSPARDIELKIGWSADLPYEITAAPAFTSQSILLASSQNLYCYDKKKRELQWEKTFEYPINSILATGTMIGLCLQSQQTLGLDLEGNELWRQQLPLKLEDFSQLHVREITSNEDKRIDRGITVIPLEKGMAVLDSQNGTIMSELQLNDRLRYLSAYDDYDLCFYTVVANSIICIELHIVN